MDTTKYNIRLIALVGAIVAAIVGGIYISRGGSVFNPFYNSGNPRSVVIGGKTLDLSIAATEQSMAVGLSNRTSLPQDEGMLFMFTTPTTPAFWMKGMKFPIDIVWIKDTTIVSISASLPVPDSTNYPTYSPKSEINRALEINSGWAAAHNVKAGDKVEFK